MNYCKRSINICEKALADVGINCSQKQLNDYEYLKELYAKMKENSDLRINAIKNYADAKTSEVDEIIIRMNDSRRYKKF